MKYRNIFVASLSFAILFGCSSAVKADTTTSTAATTTVHLTLRYQDRILFDDVVAIPASTTFSYHNNGDVLVQTTTTEHASVLSALVEASMHNDAFHISDLAYYANFNSFLLNCISLDSAPTSEACYNWQYVANGQYGDVGIDTYTLHSNDQIVMYFGDRYQILTEASTYAVGTTVTTTLREYDFQNGVYTSNTTAIIGLLDASGTTITEAPLNSQGQMVFTASSTGVFQVGLANTSSFGTFYWPTSQFTVDWPTRLSIRYQDQLIFDAQVPLPTSTTFTYHEENATTTLATTTIGASVLSLIEYTSQQQASFQMTDLAYYPNFSSFLLNCLNWPSTTTPACYNWQYVVNGVYPSLGFDQYLLTGGEHVYLYFGDRYQLGTNKQLYALGEIVSSTFQEYNFTTNVFTPVATGTLGLIDTLSHVLATSSLSAHGEAFFTPTTTGTLRIGLENPSPWGAYYWPTTAIVVTTTAQTETSNPSGSFGGGGGGGGSITHKTIDIPRATQFLVAHQQPNGSFGNSALYSDWAGIALVVGHADLGAKDRLKQYLLANPFPGSLTTDYERRAMTLLALGLNPYTGTSVNTIQAIVTTFDNTQIGNPTQVNDDIFALFPLLKSGYTISDTIVSSTVAFIVKSQENDGSWGGVDLTAAGVQALSLVKNMFGVPEALSKAKVYLHNAQQANGSFGNSIDSTAWAIQAIVALGESVSDPSWIPSSTSANEYLLQSQNHDGGLRLPTDSENNRIWSTSYTIPAALGKTWGDILTSVTKYVSSTSTSAVSNTGSGFVGFTTITPSPSSTPLTTSMGTTTESSTTTATPLLPTTHTITPRAVTALAPTFPQVEKEKNQIAEGQTIITRTANDTLTPVIAPTEPQTITVSSAAGETMSAPTVDTTPLQKTARGVFASATVLASTMGAYLAWRFLQGLI